MKRIILIVCAMLATTALAPTSVAGNSVTISGDSTIVVESGDTTIIVGLSKIGNKLQALLDDTVFNGESEASTSESSLEYETMLAKERTARNQEESRVIRTVTATVFMTIFLISLCGMIVYYKLRRSKYRVMEKAIENNYPLSDSLFTGVQSHTVYVQQSPDGTATTPPQRISLSQGINPSAYRNSFVLIAVGLGLSLFFLLADATPMAALCSILILLGIGKVVITYWEQKNYTSAASEGHSQRETPPPPPFPRS